MTTHPFGHCGAEPRELLEGTGWEIRYNPFGRRLKRGEVADLVRRADGVIAGTEPYPAEVLEQAERLKVISRVGVGFDNVDLEACRRLGIAVTYTPEAPVEAVAEMTVAQILNLLRTIHRSDRSVRELAWNRYLGYLVREVQIGVLGVGRIGKRVVQLLRCFGGNIVGCDLQPDEAFGRENNLTWMSIDDLLRTSDVVTLHVPLNRRNVNLIGAEQLAMMKPGGFVVNLSRGKVVDEVALLEALRSGHLGGAAMDVFAEEPYAGPLIEMDNVLLTAHMGASAHQSRFLMELDAARDCVRVLGGDPPRSAVPFEEPAENASRTP